MRKLLASLVLLLLAVISASAQGAGILYDNGTSPCQGGCTDAWTINNGHVVSDSIFVTTSSKVTGFEIWTWEFPGDKVLRIGWSITSSPFGGTIYGSGTALVRSDVLLGVNEYGYDIDKVTVTGLNVDVPAGTSWINLQNAVTEMHNPVYWDENSGNDCHSPGCPSSASDNQVGTIPSETFDVQGTHRPGTDDQSTNPEPSSSTLWGPALLGLAATLRRFVL